MSGPLQLFVSQLASDCKQSCCIHGGALWNVSREVILVCGGLCVLIVY